MNNWLVLLLGILSTTQTHLAKALERQGIETLDLLRARLQRTGEQFASGRRKPLIYSLGLILNHTTFLYHLLVTPLGGATAQYTSMYGVGLLVLLAYAARVMKEKLSRRELAGALLIFLGTLTVGLASLAQPALDMGAIQLGQVLSALLLLTILGLFLLAYGLRRGSPDVIGLAFGLCAGICGSLDPFLKGVSQASGESNPFLPGPVMGWALLAFSFLVGEAAVVITQWGFYRRARASILVPAYNCAYIALPVILQCILLPGYTISTATGAGLGLVMLGFALVGGFRS